MQTRDRRMIRHGVFLFLLGLVTGVQERRFRNMRMALSAPLEGVMNGTFLIAMGTTVANPIVSQGLHGKLWQERVVALGFRSMRNSLFVAVLLVLYGLARRRSSQPWVIADRINANSLAQQTS
jgi:(hydroxyamino)benzene mutase